MKGFKPILLFLILLISTTTFSQDITFGTGIGFNYQKNRSINNYKLNSLNEGISFIIGYQFNKKIGIIANYTNFFEINKEPITYDSWYFDTDLKYSFLNRDKFESYFVAGLGLYRESLNIFNTPNADPIAPNNTEYKNIPIFILGLGSKFKIHKGLWFDLTINSNILGGSLSILINPKLIYRFKLN